MHYSISTQPCVKGSALRSLDLTSCDLLYTMLVKNNKVAMTAGAVVGVATILLTLLKYGHSSFSEIDKKHA